MIKKAPKKYEPSKKEKEIQKWWKSRGIYEKVNQSHREDPDWYFLDGPPYVSGEVHLGTAWNRIIKDAILRFKTMQGFNVRKQPGWDCHGLPIEVQVEEKLGIESKKDIEEKFGIEKFIKECKNWATEHVDIMTEQFKRLGAWMDWDNPYLTFTSEYLESAWWTFKKAHEKDLMEKRLQVIQWCPRCETALAEHEVRGEYRSVKDPSLYARFKLKDESDEYLLVWTTTPWTIPANVAVCVHPDLYYAKVEVEGNTYIMAEALVSKVMNELGIYDYRRADLVKGEELGGIQYEHPLLEEVPKQREFESDHKVITGDHVTLEEGTGCVHTAPGHGEEDFEIGKTYDLPVFSPVGEDGKFTEDAGKYNGLYVKKADEKILDDLEEKGVLIKRGIIRHSYPHCWRCKTPLIFRATDQWFLDVSKIKTKILEQNSEKVRWVPEWAEKRFNDGVESVGDWCISRQRYWGIPLPIWSCAECGHRIIIGSKDELLRRSKEKIEDIDLHRPHVDKVSMECPKCGGDARRVPDVLDVWFDSGIAPWASLGFPKEEEKLENLWPSDFITEGEDQITKWFYAQQVASMIAFEDLPYREALMHGFTLDEKGKKMSKSLGNVVKPSEIIEKYGADVLRFYLLHTSPVWEDLRFNWDEVEVAERLLKVLWNSFVFATTYMSLDGFDPQSMREEEIEENLTIEDKWLLSRTNGTIKKVTENLENRNFHKATRALESLILEDLSRWYIKLIRRRTWIESEDPKKEVAYQTLYRAFEKLLGLLAPIMPHAAEEMYRRMIRESDLSSRESVHQLDWPEPKEDRIDEELEEDMEVIQNFVEAGAKARQRSGLKRRWPVKRIMIKAYLEKTKNSVKRLEGILRNQLNCKEVEAFTEEEFSNEVELVCQVDSESLQEQFGNLVPSIEKKIKNMPLDDVRERVKDRGFVEITAEGEKVKVGQNNLSLDELPEELVGAESGLGEVIVDTSVNRELKSERLTRDVVRRLQEMRKEMDLEMEERVKATIRTEEDENIEYLKNQEEYIKREVRVRDLEIGKPGEVKNRSYKKEWTIDGQLYELSMGRMGE
ncbi:isoleucyl-tRNA synthetase [candidate division MSBL1 archaeon SCGC-AAA259A05]|uniref:Isoleucine--tRNA ligase n=1 Tax=candidate division MSBL1 archaeon SCGC-AAA259A05 TaxID=1698259 RepID=A0A133U8W5_9EURY|nr:isoleucyl-tRNA synthetase [candidate division MSBL1 archaeon SCGC-AAA259A05]